jgi:hypothetical protein
MEDQTGAFEKLWGYRTKASVSDYQMSDSQNEGFGEGGTRMSGLERLRLEREGVKELYFIYV